MKTNYEVLSVDEKEIQLINGDRNLPFVKFDPSSAIFEIRGRSSPENAFKFFSQVYEWFDTYNPTLVNSFIANFYIEYFNTSSLKCLVGIIRRLNTIEEEVNHITINWFYEEDDEDILEMGEDLEFLSVTPFNYLPVDDF